MKKRIKLKYLLVFVLFLNIFQVNGQDDDTLNQTQMNIKAQKEFIEADSLLKCCIKDLTNLGLSDSNFVSNLEESQKKWLEWRDFEVKTFFYSLGNESSMSNYCYYRQMLEYTNQRIEIIKLILEKSENSGCLPFFLDER